MDMFANAFDTFVCRDSKFIQIHRFAILFSRIVYFLSVCSIVVTTLYMFILLFLCIFQQYPIMQMLLFYNLYISVVFASVDVIRNTGIFREPGSL